MLTDDERAVRSTSAAASRRDDADDDDDDDVVDAGGADAARDAPRAAMRGETSSSVVMGVPVMVSARDALEDALDDVVANVSDGGGSSGEGDEAARDVEGGTVDDENAEDMFTRVLAPKFWLEVLGVRVHVSVWVLYLWGFVYATALLTISAFAGDKFGIVFFATSVVGLAFLMWFIFALLFSSAFIHEYAHIVAVRHFGGRVDEDKGVVLWPFGAMAYLHLDGLTLTQEMLVTIAGPLSHLPQMLFWYVLSLMTSSSEDDAGRAIASAMIALNAVLLVWNLLPCYPMDGSRILCCALLLTRRIKVESAAWIVVIVSYIASISYVVASLGGAARVLSMFSVVNLDWIFGVLCVVATTNVAVMLKHGRIRDHPTFSRYEIVYDAYHAFDSKPHPEIFLCGPHPTASARLARHRTRRRANEK